MCDLRPLRVSLYQSLAWSAIHPGMYQLLFLCSFLACQQVNLAAGFIFNPSLAVQRSSFSFNSRQGARKAGEDQSEVQEDGTEDIQWELFKRHHVGSWKGLWTTFDAMGDKLIESAAIVDNALSVDKKTIESTQSIVEESVSADCPTCFDSSTSKDISRVSYDATIPDWASKYRLKFGANGMVAGPKVLRTGAMSTELALRFRDSRLRVVFQHAPVWEVSSEESGPPDGLQLFRVMVSREDSNKFPTPQTQPEFFRGVPPFKWHKEWSGTSWTWGVEAGDRGWEIKSLSEDDDWHGSAPPEAWNLRLPGGIFVQAAPKIIQAASVGLCRVAWLVPGLEEGDPQELLRLEVGVQALQEIVVQDDEVVGFAPPTLATYRCDVLKEVGELQGQPSFVDMMREDRKDTVEAAENVNTVAKPISVKQRQRKSEGSSDDGGMESIRDTLQL